MTASSKAALAQQIPRRASVAWWLGLAFAVVFAALVVPSITADRWLDPHVSVGAPAGYTVRVPPLGDAGGAGAIGGIVIARGEVADQAQVTAVEAERARVGGATPYIAYFVIVALLGAIFTHHMRRSNRGRLVRVQLASLAVIAVAAAVMKVALLVTNASILIVPVALFAMVPTLVLDRTVGLATGILAALVFSFIGPFDLGVACLLLVQASVAGLVVPERPKYRVRAALVGGGAAIACTAVTYPLLALLSTGGLPAGELGDVLHSPWYAATLGPVLATLACVALVPIYQLVVGEITQSHLTQLTELSHPLLKQIAEKAPGTWQHSLMMANLAEIAANAIGADGRLVRVGAYFHDLGKSLAPKYFIENLEPGETSPHDQLPPELSCEAIFKHVTEGIVAARKAGLHERIVDFMHMHHGNGVLEYFWGKTKEQGNPKGLTIEDFRYPGHPPQSRETAILAICDAVEAASRTLKKPEAAAIDSLVQRIVYGKLHLGQLDESGLSMSDLRRIADSLRETIRHANHGRIEYPWQKEEAAAAAAAKLATSNSTTNENLATSTTSPRLDSLDTAPAKKPKKPAAHESHDDAAALAETANLHGAVPVDDDEPAPAAKKPAAMIVEDQVRRAAGLDGAKKPGSKPPESKPVATKLGVEPAPKPSDRLSALGSRPEGAAIPADSRQPTADSPVSIIDPRPVQTLAEIELVAPAARKRAATLPPVPGRRSPTIPPTMISPPRSKPQSGLPRPTAGFTQVNPNDIIRRPFDDNALTNPPPVATFGRAQTNVDEWSDAPGVVTSAPAKIPATVKELETLEIPVDALDALAAESGRTNEHIPVQRGDTYPPGAHTDVTKPRIVLPLVAPASNPSIKLPADKGSNWASGLASRIDAAVSDDEFGGETPIVAPTKAELQALLATAPDPTRKQSVDEIEAQMLREAASRATDEENEPEFLRRRAIPQTSEVNPDDIEAIIEVAPAARRPTSVGVAKAKPKKPE